ncbi:MAG: tetratricopeptide repeat protein [Candidatus Sericytochromatia bacterium]|nr:tetratricopeptide repeat protein [Candidatus Sericytochromatia bacterium]
MATALAHHQAGRMASAEPLYRQVLQSEPNHPDALHLLGLLALQTDHPQEAFELIGRALGVVPHSPVFHNSLGTVLQRLDRIDEALGRFQAAVAIKPDYQDARDNLARMQAVLKEQSLQRYQQDVESRRQSRYMDYPAHVHLETLAVCTAACNFCPYPSLERKGTRMDSALIAKVIQDLTEIPADLPFQLSPFKVNEPFLDERLFDILASCNEKLPNAGLTLTSNASPLTEAKLNRLAQVRNLSYLWLSVNDHRPDAYEATMKLPYALTMERLALVHRKFTSGELAVPIILSRVGDGTDADDAFCQWVTKTFPGFQASVFQRGAWLGQVDVVVPDVPAVGCVRWFELSITATGIVAHCCMDGQAKWPIGDVSQQHVLEIYNAPEYRGLREKTLTRLDASPCNECTFL